MRIVLVSDIHSNQVALEAVLAAAGPFDELWNLGDTIGYGPRPNECMDIMRQRASKMIGGNHDLACIGQVDLSDFNPDARTANIWNGKQLLDEHRAFLEALPATEPVNERFLLAHGSPREPIWEYLLSAAQARANFALFGQQVCLIGHSHVPLVIRGYPDGTCDEPIHLADGKTCTLEPGVRYFFNPGSVGQPRDQDSRAAYGVLDPDAGSLHFHRVPYDIAQTQRQMREAKLPPALIRRLEYGM